MTGCPIKRIITFKEAVVYAPIKIFDELNQDITTGCEYSWSVDGACWTSWVSYDQYTHLIKNIESDYFLRVLISGGLGKVAYDNVITNCYSICFDQSNAFLKSFCDDSNLFQPYTGLDCALLLQQQMADSVICMLGIPIYYIRVLPDRESADYTFKEWTLHNVVDIKQLKLMIPDGQMPSSNPKLTDFDFDWEVDWETELSKSQFARAFGDTAFPKQRDLVYIPLMKRLWEVNSAYDEKNEGLLWRPTTWKLALVKYNEKTNVDKGDFQDIIDGWVVNKYEDIFGEKESIEQERDTAQGQITSPERAATNLYNIFMEDAIRKEFTKDYITVQDKILCHYSNITSRNMYRPRRDNVRDIEGTIVYQNQLCGPTGWLSFIIETPGSAPDCHNKKILQFSNLSVTLDYDKKYVISWGGKSCELNEFRTYMVILKWNGRNKTTDLLVYEQVHDGDMPAYLLRPEMYHWDFANPVVHQVGSFNESFDESFGDAEPYNDDWTIKGDCMITPWPLGMTNIKYYMGEMSDEDILKEVIKYTTTNEQCVINDLARPILDGHGYSTK